jgi:hypothetical protein
LGCFDSDLYQIQFNIPRPAVYCESTPNYADIFYTTPLAIAYFDKRIAHILSHRNTRLGNQTWGSLSNVIYAFDIQSQAEYKLSPDYNLENSWMCDRATKMRPYLSNGVLISTGATGNIDMATRLNNYLCADIDIIALGDQEVRNASDWEIFETKFRKAVLDGQIYKKTVILEHFNPFKCAGAYNSSSYVNLAKSLNISWMIWGVSSQRFSTCEFYTSKQDLWKLLSV